MLFTNKIKKIQFKESIKVVVAYMETYNTNVWFPQISILSSWKVNENSKGRGGGGSQQPNCLRKSMKLNWKFQGVGGSKENTFHGGGMIIPGPHNVILSKKFHFPA